MTSAGRPQVAVVTGASGGLGAGLAAAFLSAGIRVGACARRQPDLPDPTVGLAASVDVTDAQAVEQFLGQVVDALGPVDLWVNNAGILGPVTPLRDITTADFRRTLDVNLLGVVHGTQTFVRHRRSLDGGGVLVNISSGAAQRGIAGWAAYCAGKAGVDRVTEVVALEEADIGLRAYAVAPGLVDTPMQSTIRSTPAEHFPTRQRYLDAKQQGSFNSPEHIARWILALAEGNPDGTVDDTVVQRAPDQG